MEKRLLERLIEASKYLDNDPGKVDVFACTREEFEEIRRRENLHETLTHQFMEILNLSLGLYTPVFDLTFQLKYALHTNMDYMKWRIPYGKKELNVLSLGERGQVTLPKVMRERLSLKKNSRLAATMVGNTIVLHPIDDELEALFDSIALKLKGAGVTEKELLQKTQKARKRIYRQNYNKGNSK